ncbi:unnamed protein product [Calypogeia fissa]
MENDPRNFWSPSLSAKVPAISSSRNTVQKRSLHLDDLIPGIPNEIALRYISTKFSWKDFHVLSSVSRGWRHAIRGRGVYNARVHLQTRETLALILYGYHFDPHQLAVCSMRDGSSFLLPPIPGFEGGVPRCSQCVSLDGRIYVLGGLRDYNEIPHGEVYLLDLAGQIEWKLCASMRVLEPSFRCRVHHGKIYVFGGSERKDDPCGQVYDPKTNTWSPRTTTMRAYGDRQLESLGGELFLLNRTWDKRSQGIWAYHPVHDEWRKVDLEFPPDELPFVAHGKWHLLGHYGIRVHDADQNLWIGLHHFR